MFKAKWLPSSPLQFNRFLLSFHAGVIHVLFPEIQSILSVLNKTSGSFGTTIFKHLTQSGCRLSVRHCYVLSF